MILTKETLDRFLVSSESLLEAELEDNEGNTLHTTLFKRRAGKYAHIIYYMYAPLTDDRTAAHCHCEAYAVMLFAPHRREVFLTKDQRFLGGLNELLHCWYAGQNVIPDGKMDNIGHRLTSMYLRDNLGQSGKAKILSPNTNRLFATRSATTVSISLERSVISMVS